MKKVSIFQSLPLCFLLIAITNTHPLEAATPEPVVDKQGEPLQAGVGYYVWPLWADNGGLTLSNKTCPLNVIRDPSFIGLPVRFRAKGLNYVPTETDLTIDFSGVKTTCNQPTVWKLLKEASGLWFLSTGGDSQSLTSMFKIERLEGDHAYEIYSFKFCPSVPGVLCAPVGTFVDSDETKVMAVGDGVETYYVRFQKVSSYSHKQQNQAFSIL